MEPRDLALLRIPSAPSVSPDGCRIAVSVSRIDLEEDAYRAQIWVLPVAPARTSGDGPRAFTHGYRDTEPRWSPDGRWLAFLRAVKGGKAQLHVMPADGGEPRPLCEHPLGVSEPVWSPDSTRIAYIARVPEPGRYESGPEARPAGREAPRRITRLRYRRDNVGFLIDQPARLHVVEIGVDAGPPLTLTTGGADVAGPAFSPDGRWIAVATRKEESETSMAGDILLIAADGGERRWVTASSTTVGPPTFSLDGRTLYYTGSEQLDAARAAVLFAVPTDASAAPRALSDPETDDLHDSHSAARPLATPTGVLVVSARRGALELVRVPDGDGPVERLVTGAQQICDVAVGGQTVAVIRATDVCPGEVAILEEGRLRVLSEFSAPLARGTSLRPLCELTATAPDGYPVHGWLVLPAGTGPFPVLLVIHGGPFTQFGYSFFDEAQAYAGAGYAVVLANPRGSSGYGESHGRAILGEVGGLDRADLLAVLDAACAHEAVDATRVGVMGGSYGGLMTTWLAGHDGARFQAAISERALNAWDSFTGSSDIGWFFTRDYVGQDPVRAAAQSPLTFAGNIEIPMLLIHSELDWRCPVEQAQRLFVALKLRGVPVEMLLFPGEGHELSRSGLPSHRLARFEAILEWWARHLAAPR